MTDDEKTARVEELHELLELDDPPAPTDQELGEAIERQDAHAARLRQQYAALDHATELVQAVMMEGLKVLPHLLAAVNDDPKESGQRIADGLLRWLRKR